MISEKIAEPYSRFVSEDEGETWRAKLDFRYAFFACMLGYATEDQDVLPTAVERFGGAIFLIPYTFMLASVTFPITYLSILIGQFTTKGIIGSMEICPIFKGIGYSIVLKLLLQMILSMVGMSRLIIFTIKSLNIDLRARFCNNTWNSDHCYSRLPNVSCDRYEMRKHESGVCFKNNTKIGIWNFTLASQSGISRTSPISEYLNSEMFDTSDDITKQGALVPICVGVLAVCWFINIFPVLRGVRNYGWFHYIITAVPCCMLIIFILIGIFYHGIQLINFNLKWKALAEIDSWREALHINVKSMGSLIGALLWLSSFNHFKRHCLNDAVYFASGYLMISLLRIVYTFQYTGIAIENIIGLHLTTSDHPQYRMCNGMAYMPVPQAALFFCGIMNILLRVGATAITCELLIDSSITLFRFLGDCKIFLIIMYSFSSFVIGLAFCVEAGEYNLSLVRRSLEGYSDYVVLFLILVIYMWIYGWEKWSKCILVMEKGVEVWVVWRIFWSLITPGILVSFLLFAHPLTCLTTMYETERMKIWYYTAKNFTSVLLLLPILIHAVVAVCRDSQLPLKTRLKKQFAPSANWGPALNNRLLLEHIPGFDSNVGVHELNLQTDSEKSDIFHTSANALANVEENRRYSQTSNVNIFDLSASNVGAQTWSKPDLGPKSSYRSQSSFTKKTNSRLQIVKSKTSLGYSNYSIHDGSPSHSSLSGRSRHHRFKSLLDGKDLSLSALKPYHSNVEITSDQSYDSFNPTQMSLKSHSQTGLTPSLDSSQAGNSQNEFVCNNSIRKHHSAINVITEETINDNKDDSPME